MIAADEGGPAVDGDGLPELESRREHLVTLLAERRRVEADLMNDVNHLAAFTRPQRGPLVSFRRGVGRGLVVGMGLGVVLSLISWLVKR